MLNTSPGNFILNDEFLQKKKKKNKEGERDQQGECKNCSS